MEPTPASRIYYKELKRIELLSDDEFNQLIQERTPEAINKIWKASLRLVFMTAKMYFGYLDQKSGLTRDDLVSAGNMGVYRAIQTYKAGRGKFTFWVFRHVQSNIQTEIAKYGKTVKIPNGKHLKDDNKPYSRVDLLEVDYKVNPQEEHRITDSEIFDLLKGGLTRKERLFVKEVYLNGLMQADVADKHRCSRQNVNACVLSGLKKLRKKKALIKRELGRV